MNNLRVKNVRQVCVRPVMKYILFTQNVWGGGLTQGIGWPPRK